MELFFDTETTGVPKRYDAPISDVDNYPRLVQLGWIVMHGKEVFVEREEIIAPQGFEIPIEASNVHKITTEIASQKGFLIENVLEDFSFWVEQCNLIIGHNVSFDLSVVGAEYWRIHQTDLFAGKKTICTMKSSVQFCGIPRPSGGFKYPKLHELYFKLFDREMGAAHTALQDIQNTAKCYFELVERGVINVHA